jgi:Domain of unknown function (DUF4260)
MSTIVWQRIEGAIVFAAVAIAVVVLNSVLPVVQWWWLLLAFFAPDIGFAGYLAGPRAGAFIYNSLHLYGIGAAVALIGFFVLADSGIGLLGLLWLGHVGFDRMFGYGLKEPTAFADTHLGRIGRARK